MGRHNIFSTTAPRPSRVRFAVSRAAALTLVVAVIGWIALSILFAPADPNEVLTSVDTDTGQQESVAPEPGVGGESAAPDGSADTEPGSQAAPGGTLVVHVVGAVHNPGVYRLPSGARIVDAIEAAGGMTGSARPELLNLASPIADGQQVVLPDKDDPPEASPGAQAPPAGSGTDAKPSASTPAGSQKGTDQPVPGDKIPINQADAETLMQLPGIGPALAGRIIEFREANGPFKSVEELEQVSGIGPVLMGKLRELVQAP